MSQRRSKTEEDMAAQIGLGLAIERLRRERGWTRDKLAKRSHLTGKPISDVESARAEMTWGNLRLVARGLDIELADLNRPATDYALGKAGDKLRTREQTLAGNFETKALVKAVGGESR